MIYDGQINFFGSPNEKGAIKLVLSKDEGRESDHTVFDPMWSRGLHMVTYYIFYR